MENKNRPQNVNYFDGNPLVMIYALLVLCIVYIILYITDKYRKIFHGRILY